MTDEMRDAVLGAAEAYRLAWVEMETADRVQVQAQEAAERADHAQKLASDKFQEARRRYMAVPFEPGTERARDLGRG